MQVYVLAVCKHIDLYYIFISGKYKQHSESIQNHHVSTHEFFLKEIVSLIDYR